MRTRAAAGLALVAAALLACAQRVSPPAERAFDRFVLVTIDTLRADHLGAYGYPRPTSPFFDGLAPQGVLFERAHAPMATTAPSHASLFTSRYPLEHQVLRNGLVLDDGFVTLAERLAAAGYRTAGFVAAGDLFAAAGLGQGFQTFDAPPPPEDGAYRAADRTVDAALDWLEQTSALEQPLFLWVHLFDPHGPLVPPERYRKLFEPHTDKERLGLARFLLGRHHVKLGTFGAGLQGMIEQYTNYDAEVRFADTELGRLFQAVQEQAAGRTLWVITADHGQGLGSHRFFGHGKNIYQEQVRVPLLFYASDGSFPARRVRAVVEHVDLAPTLLELAGVAASGPILRGRSLVDLLRGGDEKALAGRQALVQRRAYEEPDPRWEELGHDYELGEKYALVGARWKYIHRTVGVDELYDLRADPYETRNLAAADPVRAERLRTALEERLAELRGTGAAGEPASVDGETLKRLEALGYVP
jgi:arylsulfatase A-like enzyme